MAYQLEIMVDQVRDGQLVTRWIKLRPRGGEPYTFNTLTEARRALYTSHPDAKTAPHRKRLVEVMR